MIRRIAALAVAALAVAVASTVNAQNRGAAPVPHAAGQNPSKRRAVDWYRPTEVESRIRWNAVDPWMGQWPTQYAGLTTAFHSFVAGQRQRIGSEFALRYEPVPGFGVVVGSYVPRPDAWFMGGLEFFRGWGVPLIDLLDRDVQIGILFPDVQARIMTNFRQVNALNFVASATGVRVVCCDFFRLDVRVVPASVMLLFSDNGSITGYSYAWGMSLDTGVVF